MDAPDPGTDAPSDAPWATPPVAPAVVAVVVAHDPGVWFDDTMRALAAQDYPNLAILVIDAASAEEVKPAVARSAPGAFVRRLDTNPGFGAAANEVIEVVEGAAFYLVCHDDIAPEPDVVRLLVEEAFRSNAALVGTKLVSWDEPRRLLQVGEAIDQVGYTIPLVERGELDQAQHDAVRDVFSIPGACTLVRADLFETVGGFDEGIDFLLDDLSLCWRAHVAGGRVIVAPGARVRHLEALAARRSVDDRRRLQSRHRLRVVLSTYRPLSLLWALVRLLVLNLGEVLYSAVAGRGRQVRDVVGSWIWNLRRIGELRDARRQVAEFRRTSDREIRGMMMSGSARLSQFVRGQIGRGEDRMSGLARGGRDVAGALRSGTLRSVAAVWVLVGLVLLAGSRHLISRGVPAVGEMVAFTGSPLDLGREWLSGWRPTGLGSEAPAPTLLGGLGALGVLFAGAMGLLRTVLTVGLIPFGAVAAYRVAGPTGSRYAQVVCLLIYVAVPLPYNALSAGRWGALALYAGAPVLIGQLVRASRVAPFGDVGGPPGPGVRERDWVGHVLSVGVTTAVIAMVLPAVVPLVVVMAVGLVLGGLVTFSFRGGLRLLATALGGAVVAVVLHLPWSLDLIVPGSSLDPVTGVGRGGQVSDLAALLRFEVGPLGSAPLGWSILVAAALPLLIGRAERHAWAVRGWTLAVVSFGLAWASQRGSGSVALPAPEVLLAPAAIGLALAAAMGVAAFEVDLPGYRFGWRQIASGLAAVAVVTATLPVLGASLDGRWSMPAGDHARALAFVDEEAEDTPFRVLWIGDPMAVPLGGWELDEGVAYATSTAGTPGPDELLVGSDEGRTGLLADAVDLATAGQTARLGRLLAPMGVRYVVVPERLAPAPFATEDLAIPNELITTLAAQLDLQRVDVPAGLLVFRNRAFLPLRSGLATDALPTDGGITAAIDLDLSGAAPVLTDESGPARWSGPLDAGTTVFLSAAHSERWELTVGGETAERSKPFGWATAFAVPDSGEATLRFQTPMVRYLLLALQVLLWVWALRWLLRGRLNPATPAAPALAPPSLLETPPPPPPLTAEPAEVDA